MAEAGPPVCVGVEVAVRGYCEDARVSVGYLGQDLSSVIEGLFSGGVGAHIQEDGKHIPALCWGRELCIVRFSLLCGSGRDGALVDTQRVRWGGGLSAIRGGRCSQSACQVVVIPGCHAQGDVGAGVSRTRACPAKDSSRRGRSS